MSLDILKIIVKEILEGKFFVVIISFLNLSFI